jgi:hypothetical protein
MTNKNLMFVLAQLQKDIETRKADKKKALESGIPINTNKSYNSNARQTTLNFRPDRNRQ